MQKEELFRTMINQKCREVHADAKAKGWWEIEKSPLEIYALVISEISEAVEEARKGSPAIYFESKIGGGKILQLHEVNQSRPDFNQMKPEGEAVEMADAIIRMFDWCGFKGWDLGKAIEMKIAYNKTRSHRHGGKLY